MRAQSRRIPLHVITDFAIQGHCQRRPSRQSSRLRQSRRVHRSVIVLASKNSNSRLKFGPLTGVCISASFLFLIAVINAIILHRTLQARKRLKRGEVDPEEDHTDLPGGWISKMAYPLFKLIDAPWKLMPLGMLFGLGARSSVKRYRSGSNSTKLVDAGFDTASSILLLSVSATASSALRNRPGELILLPLLFTAGMTAIDTIDGVVMVYAYSIDALPEKKWQLFDKKMSTDSLTAHDEVAQSDPAAHRRRGKTESLMNVSIFLTAVSIAVALLVAIIEVRTRIRDTVEMMLTFLTNSLWAWPPMS